MRIGLVFYFFCFLLNGIQAQSLQSLDDLQPPAEYDNVHLERIDGDSLSTSFVIWIKQEVTPHYHEYHSEQVLVLSGTALMKLGEKELKIKANDLIFIPAQTIHSVKVTSKEPLKVLSIQSPEFKGKDRILVEEETK